MTTTETVAVPEGFTVLAGSEPTRATMFGRCPDDAKGRHVSIYFRRGTICHDVMLADILNWTHSGSGDDIIAYRIESSLSSAEPVAFDFAAHLARQAAWSAHTFGPGSRAAGVVDHIRKELTEIEADPGDLKEWIDVVILALDGAWRSGATPAEIVAALAAKQEKNEGRSWPDWRTADPSKAIEHDRSKDTRAQPAAKVEVPRSDSDIADAISGLEEAYRFASTSPRAQEAINFAIEVMGRTASPTPASVPDGWVPLGLGPHPVRNSCVVYWHESAHGGFPATADEWRDEHHLPFATHWHPGASTNPNPSEPTP